MKESFSATYAEARDKFLAAAEATGARLSRHENPAKGPEGEMLSTDVARIGPADASRVLLTISATHGVEGFCGSGIQVASFPVLKDALPPDTAFVAVHANNPYGFAWLRRVTQENVDLNRNFVDHKGRLPENPAYDELADAICPAEWTNAGLAAAQKRLDAYAEKHGAFALQGAISGGQYKHADGIFYGGNAPTAARQIFERVLSEQLGKAKKLAVIDFHTGLGPWGYGEPIVLHPPESDAMTRAKAWYGEVTSPFAGSSSSAVVTGHTLTVPQRLFPGLEFTGMALEYGTLPMKEVLDAVRADNWLHTRGDLGSAKGKELKRQMRDAFYGDKDDWKEMVAEQGIQRQRQALAGLTA
jgi:hypothetical protein